MRFIIFLLFLLYIPSQRAAGFDERSFVQLITSTENALGRELLPAEFWNAWNKHAKNEEVEISQLREGWNWLCSSHSPYISADDLELMLDGIRSNLTEVHFEYSYTPQIGPKEYREFSSSGEKLRTLNADTKTSGAISVVAFNGRVTQQYGRNKTGEQYGLVSPNLQKSQFLDLNGNILIRSLLLDLKMYLGGDYSSQDYSAFLKKHDEGLLWISSDLLEHDGQMCVVVASPNFEVWIAPELGFAVVRTVEWTNLQNKVYASTEVNFRNFAELENGMWLAREFTVKRLSEQSKAENASVRIKTFKLHLTEKDRETLFDDIIPKGILVTNKAADLTYFEGTPKSITEILEPVIPQKKTWAAKPNIPLYFLANLLLTCAAVCYLFFQKRRRKV